MQPTYILCHGKTLHVDQPTFVRTVCFKIRTNGYIRILLDKNLVFGIWGTELRNTTLFTNLDTMLCEGPHEILCYVTHADMPVHYNFIPVQGIVGSYPSDMYAFTNYCVDFSFRDEYGELLIFDSLCPFAAVRPRSSSRYSQFDYRDDGSTQNNSGYA